MTNKELLHKALDLNGLKIQSVNKTLEQVSMRMSKKRPGYIKCITDDNIAQGLMYAGINEGLNKDKGLVGFMIFVPESEFKKMYEEEIKSTLQKEADHEHKRDCKGND